VGVDDDDLFVISASSSSSISFIPFLPLELHHHHSLAMPSFSSTDEEDYDDDLSDVALSFKLLNIHQHGEAGDVPSLPVRLSYRQQTV
jgi:hypothetical protein